MEQEEKILEGYSDLEKGAYLGAIASIATADRQATEDEIEFINILSESAALSDEQAEMIRRAATELEGNELEKCLDILKGSELRFSLVTDMISLAESDKTYGEEEKQAIAKIANYLEVNQQQFSLLDEFSKKAKEENVDPVELSDPSFLSNTGLGDKMQKAGINPGGLLKGLLGVMGPIILGRMLSGGRGGGLLGGLGGGLLGGLGGMLGGGIPGVMPGGNGLGDAGTMSGLGGILGGSGLGGGLGSLTGMLGGGGLSRSGGLLGKIFGS
jgi:uncharacterized tellurite resistance protein B-like protein